MSFDAARNRIWVAALFSDMMSSSSIPRIRPNRAAEPVTIRMSIS
jgi:hypothetical protein